MLLRRAQRGRLPLLPALRSAAEGTPSAGAAPPGTPLAPPADFAGHHDIEAVGHGPLAEEQRQVELAKKACLLVAGIALQKHGEALQEQQEILARIADMVIEIFAMESGLLRARRALEHGRPSEAKIDLIRVGVTDGLFRVEGWSRQVLATTEKGEELRARLAAVRRLLPDAQPDGIRLRRRIAERLLDAGAYVT